MRTVSRFVSAEFAEWLKDEECKRPEVVRWWNDLRPEGYYLSEVQFTDNALGNGNTWVRIRYKQLLKAS